MQLIAISLLIVSLLLLLASLLFVLRAKRAFHNHIDILHRSHIGGCEISMVTLYPSSTAPLLTMLDQEYPRCEAILVCDMQQHIKTFGYLVSEYHLVRVNHDGFPYIRTLYRSRHRAFRRVVVIDIPLSSHDKARQVAHDIASYSNILYIEGDMLLEEDVVTYTANLIASKFDERPLTIKSIAGAGASLETAGASPNDIRHTVLSDRALAWRQRPNWWWLMVVATPLPLTLFAILCKTPLLLLDAALITISLLMILYVSCRIVTKKGLSTIYSTIIENFYRYIIDFFKKFHYLYKRCGREPLRTTMTNRPTTRTNRYNNIQL